MAFLSKLNEFTEIIGHNRFDYDETFIELGKSKGLNLYVGGIEKANEMRIKVDYVILNHVLEYIKNPIIFLKELKKILNVNAIISIRVPPLDLIPWGYADGGRSVW